MSKTVYRLALRWGFALRKYTVMDPDRLIHCYYTEAEPAVQEQMWRFVRAEGGWLSAHPLGLLLYCRASKSAPLLMLDPLIRRRPERDYLL